MKIAPAYKNLAIHVKDASRAVGVCRNVLDPVRKTELAGQIKTEYARLREEHSTRQTQKKFLPITEARQRGLKTDWSQRRVTTPSFLGTKVFEDFDLNELKKTIDWSPFFMAWELAGKYPRIFDDPKIGVEARKLFDDAQTLLKEIITQKLLKAKAVIGFFPANSVGDDIVVYTDDARKKIRVVFHTLRQQTAKSDDKPAGPSDREAGRPYYALADLVAPKDSNVKDYIGGFAVTAGIGAKELSAHYEREHDDYKSILVKALADRLAESFAERMHQLVRMKYWGYVPDENLSNEDLIHCRYMGIRPAPGYPACPDHTEKELLFDLLDTEKNTGIHLTESFAMMPAASVSGIYYSHPDAKYFWLGDIDKDQVIDYAARKEWDVKTVEKWLGPNLGYKI